MSAGQGQLVHDVWDAFRREQARAARWILRACFFTSVAGLLLTVVGTLVFRRGLASDWPYYVVGGACVLWFGAAMKLDDRWRTAAAVRSVNLFLLAGIPWFVLAVLARQMGFERAASTWEPMLFFASFCVMSIAWLRPVVPFGLALSSVAAYVGLWLIHLPPSTWASLPPRSPVSPAVTAYRMVLLLGLGALCAFAARGVRRALVSGVQTLRARDLFGKYRLEEPLGEGGMGTVVKATYCPEGGFERPVAIKRILPHLAQQPGAVERFRSEAELSSRLVHAHIVSVLDFGRVADTYFFAMEYVDGPSLGELLARARTAGIQLPTAVVARVGRQIASALDFAHHRAVDGAGRPLRLVHRDLCPWNVLLTRSGQVKVTDFGIAKRVNAGELAMTTEVLGKAAYTAPEILEDRMFDTRADLWSLGVLLWELLTGERLFKREGLPATVLAVCRLDIPQPSSVRKGLDPAWDAICAHLLERDLKRRLSEAQLLDALLAERLRVEASGEGDEVRQVLERVEGTLERGWVGIEVTGSSSLQETLDTTPLDEQSTQIFGVAASEDADALTTRSLPGDMPRKVSPRLADPVSEER